MTTQNIASATPQSIPPVLSSLPPPATTIFPPSLYHPLYYSPHLFPTYPRDHTNSQQYQLSTFHYFHPLSYPKPTSHLLRYRLAIYTHRRLSY